MRRSLSILILLSAILACHRLQGAETLTRQRAADSLRRAVQFFRARVSVEGSYLWQYSSDLTLREGETKATNTMAWVQPPGTPTVGAALLAAYQRTGDEYYREAAIE